MAVFPSLVVESKLQVNDRTRLDATRSYAVGGDSITTVEIDPDGTTGYIDVTDDQFLDWQYESAATYTVTVRLNSTETFTQTILVVTSATDKLFSGDADLIKYESKVLDYVPDGRNSWLNKHREAQTLIMERLDEMRLWDTEGEMLALSAIMVTAELRKWSTFKTLELIFRDLSNQIDDIFDQKATHYQGMAQAAEQSRNQLRLDRDGDAVEDELPYNIGTLTMVRR